MIVDVFFRELKAFKPAIIIANLGLILSKFIKVAVIFRIVKGFVILIGTIALLKWIGFDFSHVLNFFGGVPEMTNTQNTWLGDVYTTIFKKVLLFVNSIADNAPKAPDGTKILEALKKLFMDSKNM